jgi:hypothetical protein
MFFDFYLHFQRVVSVPLAHFRHARGVPTSTLAGAESFPPLPPSRSSNSCFAPFLPFFFSTDLRYSITILREFIILRFSLINPRFWALSSPDVPQPFSQSSRAFGSLFNGIPPIFVSFPLIIPSFSRLSYTAFHH